MFGTDYPSLPLDRLIREWDELGLSGEIMHKVFHANAERVLRLPAATVPDEGGPDEGGRATTPAGREQP
jgi:hypothetical protein